MIDTSALSLDELDIYNKLKSRLPSTINDTDLSTYTGLLSILLASVDFNIKDFYDQLDPITANETYLRLMSDMVGYRWIDSIDVEGNRQRLLSHSYRRKYRGTIESIKSLVKTTMTADTDSTMSDVVVSEGYPTPLKYNEDPDLEDNEPIVFNENERS